MTNNNYNNWLADIMVEKAKAEKEFNKMAEYVKFCFHVDAPEIRTVDELDTFYREMEDMIEDIQRMMKATAVLSDIQHELETTTPEDFED